MSKKTISNTSAGSSSATLDALLRKGIQADQRANNLPASIAAPASQTPIRVANDVPAQVPVPAPDRLTVRFTQSEAQLLEQARAIARSLGYKISDTAVFRLALHSLKPEQITPNAIRTILIADSRRRREPTSSHSSSLPAPAITAGCAVSTYW
jgi:hypothetical protein